MKRIFSRTMIAVAALMMVALLGVGEAEAQDSPQKAAASKTAKFESVAKTDALYTGAIEAHDKAAAGKLVGKDGAFRGTVVKVYTNRTGSVLILNFDRDYKTALTAALKKSEFSKFPDMSQLDGKEIVVSGKFIDFNGNTEIVLSDPKQIAVVK